MELLPFVSAVDKPISQSFSLKLSRQCGLAVLLSLSLLTGCDSSSGSTPDTTAPVITLNGYADTVHNYMADYVDAGVVATDNVDTDVTVISSGTEAVDVTTLGSTYTITYSATDAAGNEAIPVTRTVTIENTGPVIAMDSESEELGQGRDFRVLGVSAYDYLNNESLTVTADASALNLSDEGTADELGSYEVIYSATDSAGKTSTVTRTINVVEPRPFITTWETTLDEDTGALSIIIPGDDDLTTDYYTYDSLADKYNYLIDCGEDATVEGWQTVSVAAGTLNEDASFECTYTQAGVKTIKISDNLTDGKFVHLYEADQILSVEQWGDIKLLSLNSTFFRASNLQINASDTPDLRLVKSAKFAFVEVFIMDGGLGDWDVSNIEDFSYMFYGTTKFNGDISGWDVSKATYLEAMFAYTDSFNRDISGWDTSSVTNLVSTFREAFAFDQNLAQWDISSATTLYFLFKSVAISTANLDAMVIAWAKQDVQQGVEFNMGTGELSDSEEVLSAYSVLVDDKGWIITGD